jgi:hypothetical protein
MDERVMKLMDSNFLDQPNREIHKKDNSININES